MNKECARDIILYPVWIEGPKNAWEDTAASGWTVHKSKRGISAAKQIDTHNLKTHWEMQPTSL